MTPTPNVTQAYQTIEAQMTMASTLLPRTTITPLTITPSLSGPTLHPTLPTLPATLPPAMTSTPICDRAAAGNPIDTTIPDGTVMAPNTPFTKTWRIINNGTCSWTPGYAVVWFSGEIMGANQANPINVSVSPGSTVDVSVDMVAPKDPGTYIGYWKLRNANGRVFGIGPSGDSPFWVKIEVQPQTASTPTPTSQAQAIPTVLVTNLVTLLPDEAVDLSTLNKNQGSTDDLSYQVDPGTGKHTLSPLQTASLGNPLTSQPTYSYCKSAGMSSASQTLDTLGFSTYFCFKNHDNHLGWIRFISLDSDKLSLEVLTWSNQ